MHVHPISTFRLFQEGHLLRNSIAIFALTTLFYFIGAELRLVHELSLFWPLNGVMAGVFARYVWLNRLHYYAISYVAMLVYDAITTEWGLVSLVINFSNMMFIVTVALLVVRDKRLGKNKYEPVSALRLFNYCLIAALLCAIVGAIGSVSIDSLDFWPLLADWFSEQFSTGVLIVPCMLTLAIPGVLPRFKAEQMMPAIALIVSVIASVVIGGAGSLAFPLPALIWCAVRYTPQVTCLLTFVTGAVEIVLVANSVIDISVGSPFSIPEMFSARLGIATMAICPIMVSFSVAAINSLMKQVALRADFDFLTQVYSRSGLYEALKSPSLKQTQHLTVMLLDIDYFKSINDNYGHECGDKVLSVFARHIQKIVGDKGLVARMGGEEFAVAVPSVNPVDGLLMAEKIRKGVELQPFTWQQKTLYLTVSIGVGSGRASYRTLTDDFNKLMVEADTCLYRSKKDGRQWALNPATLVFMGFVLGWGFAAIRLVAGLVMVLLIATLVQKWVRETPQTQAPVEIDIPEAQGGFFSRWGRALWTLFWSTIPVYILAVLVLGAARVWLFPHADGAVDNSLMWVMAMAVAGCLFVIPTAAEIPIVQTMMLAGMGTAPALALLMTLPAVSLPSLIMLRKAFPAKALWLTGAMVAVSGVIVGGLALLF